MQQKDTFWNNVSKPAAPPTIPLFQGHNFENMSKLHGGSLGPKVAMGAHSLSISLSLNVYKILDIKIEKENRHKHLNIKS